MKTLWLLLLASMLAAACSEKSEVETDTARKEKLEKMYTTPPPSDRSKDKGF